MAAVNPFCTANGHDWAGQMDIKDAVFDFGTMTFKGGGAIVCNRCGLESFLSLEIQTKVNTFEHLENENRMPPTAQGPK